jgi:hypothetical protein
VGSTEGTGYPATRVPKNKGRRRSNESSTDSGSGWLADSHGPDPHRTGQDEERESADGSKRLIRPSGSSNSSKEPFKKGDEHE